VTADAADARSLAGQRVLVVGLGVSGFAAATRLLELDAKVKVTEAGTSPQIEQRAERLTALGAIVETGGHDLEALDGDLAVVSPGIPPTTPVIRALAEQRVEIWSEIELAYRLARCEFLAVTGTNGKTTTTSLLAAMLVEGGVESAAAGNIGDPLVDAVTRVGPEGAIAVEASSFQLWATHLFRPRVAVILNIAEDHTDWHGSVENYAAAKARIVMNQRSGDVLVANVEDERVAAIASTAPSRVVPFSRTAGPAAGIGVVDGTIVWRGHTLIDVAELSLPGAAGLEDSLAAAAAALGYGVAPKAVARSLRSFRPLRHRLQVIAEADGVTYIDDSKATNPHATLTAVRGLANVVLIAGGRSKGMDLSPLAATVPPVTAVVALGEAADEIERVFERLVPVDRAPDMSVAVRLAHARSVAGGSVLLSPACASLDMYESYAERGDDFARAVRALLDGSTARGTR